ncbi:MAG: hypothetical protein ACFFDT_16045 [Candidatus Hodarchaeota archaeon]
MKIFFDSTYFFPSIGILPEKVPEKYLLNWLEKGIDHELFCSTISLFELQAKGAKYYRTGELTPQEVTQGIASINMEPQLRKIPFWESNISLLALELRKKHNDFINCLILSSSMITADVLISEDPWMHNFLKEEFSADFAEKWTINSNFKVFTAKNYSITD